MKPNIKQQDPTPQLVVDMVPSSGTGNYRSVMAVRIPLATTSTANAATNWINPETGTVCVKTYVVFTTAGTGTFDLGRGSDGTGNATDQIDGGTMTVGVHYTQEIVGTVAASATLGGINIFHMLLGPGGSGTNNSINMTHSDTTTSTAVGALIVEYFLIEG